MANVILLRGIVTEAPDEKICSAEILPGHLVEINAGLLRKHATAAGAAEPWFALEASWNSAASTAGTPAINTPYAAGATVPFIRAHPGQKINAWLEPSHAAVVEGALLESGSGGNLQAGTTNPVARAAAAHTGSASTAVRIEVFVI